MFWYIFILICLSFAIFYLTHWSFRSVLFDFHICKKKNQVLFLLLISIFILCDQKRYLVWFRSCKMYTIWSLKTIKLALQPKIWSVLKHFYVLLGKMCILLLFSILYVSVTSSWRKVLHKSSPTDMISGFIHYWKWATETSGYYRAVYFSLQGCQYFSFILVLWFLVYIGLYLVDILSN